MKKTQQEKKPDFITEGVESFFFPSHKEEFSKETHVYFEPKQENLVFAGCRVMTEEKINSEIKNLENYHLSIPTYYFNVGDKVKIGNLYFATIEKVLLDGKAYLVRYVSYERNYGSPYIYESNNVFDWVSLRPIPTTTESFSNKNSSRLYFQERTLNGLLLTYYHFGINMSPDYQRDYVWDTTDGELLLDTIFDERDIGKIVLGKVNQNYEIIDGKQRLQTLINFYENRFSYKGKYFNDLSLTDRNVFLNTALSVGELETSDKNKILKTFISINSTGKQVSSDILENAKKMLMNM